MKKIYGILENTIIILACLFCLFGILQRTVFQDKTIFGYRMFVIITDSMAPKLKSGDIIVSKTVDTNILKKDDIIIYQGMEGEFANKIIVHQIEKVTTEQDTKIFYTRGINNGAVDPAVYERQVYGKLVYKFVLLSIINRIISTKIGFILIVVLPLAGLLVSEIYTIIKRKKESDS